MTIFGKEVEPIKFESLYGEHILSAVEHRNISRDDAGIEFCLDNEVDAIMFTLDGQSMVAIEDPDDGYRSALSGVFPIDFEPRYKIPDAKVFIAKSQQEDSNGITVFDAENGLPVLRIGTDYCSDYYPCCVMEYIPENFIFNLGKVERFDCVLCGGKGTMVGTRAPNGHFHGVCKKCGARLHA